MTIIEAMKDFKNMKTSFICQACGHPAAWHNEDGSYCEGSDRCECQITRTRVEGVHVQ